MKALIDPTTSVKYLSSWELNTDTQSKQKYIPVYSVIQNSARVCEIVEQEFPVALPLFWVDCANDVVADQWYYDTQTAQIIKIPDPAPYPQTMTEGVQPV